MKEQKQKLSYRDKEEKKLQLMTTVNTIEIAEIQKKQIERALDAKVPMTMTRAQLSGKIDEIDRLKRNLKVIEREVKTGYAVVSIPTPAQVAEIQRQQTQK